MAERSPGLARLSRLQWRVLVLAGLATLFAGFDSTVLWLALPALARDFNADLATLSRLGIVLALGALGALPVSTLADRFGRRRLLAAALAGFSLANLGSAASGSLATLAGARLVAVALESVAAGVAVALVVEELPAGVRGLGVAALTLIGGAGIGIATLAYPALAPHWRWLYWAGGLGIPAAALLWRGLPESRAWAAARHDRDPLGLLLDPAWRTRLLVVGMAGAGSAMLLRPAALFVALYGSRDLRLGPASISAVVLVSGLASVPAFPAGGWLSDRLGRRTLGAVLTGLAALAAASTFSGGLVGYWAGSLLWSVLASAAVPVLGAWYGELFPTRARATAEGAAALAGAVGGVLGLLLVGYGASRWGLGPSLLGVGLGAVLGAGALLLLPETGGQALPG